LSQDIRVYAKFWKEFVEVIRGFSHIKNNQWIFYPIYYLRELLSLMNKGTTQTNLKAEDY